MILIMLPGGGPFIPHDILMYRMFPGVDLFYPDPLTAAGEQLDDP